MSCSAVGELINPLGHAAQLSIYQLLLLMDNHDDEEDDLDNMVVQAIVVVASSLAIAFVKVQAQLHLIGPR